MNFVETYFKHPEMYYGQTLGEAFVNFHWAAMPLHKNQQKLYDEKDNRKAHFIIVMCYNDLNNRFDGDIYEQTTETPPCTDHGEGQ